jgi:hypothetical protein
MFVHNREQPRRAVKNRGAGTVFRELAARTSRWRAAAWSLPLQRFEVMNDAVDFNGDADLGI